MSKRKLDQMNNEEVKEVVDPKKYKCNVVNCNYSTKYKGHLKQHLWQSHNVGDGEIYECEVINCKYTTKCKSSLKTHLWAMHDIGEGEIYKCDVVNCVYTTKRKGDIERHLWQVHNIGDGEIYKCANCEYDTKSKDHFKRHMWEVHDIGDGDIHKCDIKNCDYSTKSKSSLKIHTWQVHNMGDGKIYECKVENCVYTAKSNSRLKTHLWEVHDIGVGEIYRCDVKNCDYTTKNKTRQKRHQWQVHEVGTGKTYKCEISGCFYTTRDNGNFKAHLSNVHDIGNHKCEFCDKNVNTLNSYSNNEKVYKICRDCFNKATGCSTSKEKQMVDYIKSQDDLRDFIISTNQIVKHDACKTLRRPDLLLSSHTLNIIVETDEFQHSGYNPACETGRMNEIIDEFKTGHVIFIRWNPDGFTIKDKGKKKNRQERLYALVDLIRTIKNNELDAHRLYEVHYMFYSEDNDVITKTLPTFFHY